MAITLCSYVSKLDFGSNADIPQPSRAADVMLNISICANAKVDLFCGNTNSVSKLV
jgi:hypothetical protein